MSKFNDGDKIPEVSLNMDSLNAMMGKGMATEEEAKALAALGKGKPAAQNNQAQIEQQKKIEEEKKAKAERDKQEAERVRKENEEKERIRKQKEE